MTLLHTKGSAIWKVWGYRTVTPHCDPKDTEDTIISMTTLGLFEGAQLVGRTHQHQISNRIPLVYPSSDLVMFQSSLIRNGVTPFKGQQTAIVLFSHGWIANWGQASKRLQMTKSIRIGWKKGAGESRVLSIEGIDVVETWATKVL